MVSLLIMFRVFCQLMRLVEPAEALADKWKSTMSWIISKGNLFHHVHVLSIFREKSDVNIQRGVAFIRRVQRCLLLQQVSLVTIAREKATFGYLEMCSM